ncbi:MAG TPA: transposase [Saprospiraceae bacterium]|nr:transposase [Saprospiraceae bacterium]
MAQVFFDSLSEDQGRPSVDLRIILGALLVKHIQRLGDEDTIDYIQENIYAQYFVGLSSFQVDPVFAPSLFVEVGKRLGAQGADRLNTLMIRQAKELRLVKHRRKPSKRKDRDDQADSNRGTMIVDATVAPLHLAFPTDSGLLNHACEHSEQLLDVLYNSARELWPVKPRTYRREARQRYIGFSKKRNKSKKVIRKAVGQQLRYVRRNIKTLHKMLDELEAAGVQIARDKHQWRMFWILQELYRQQDLMFMSKKNKIEDRLLSLQQPHARPIKRGKGGGKDTEFGPKINVSLSEGIARVDQIDFNAFNESQGLPAQIEAYKALYGYYPALVLADKIYWTRANRKYLKDKNIEIGGVPLGRKKEQSKYERERQRKRNNKRSLLIFLSLNLIKMVKTALFSLFSSTQGQIRHLTARLKRLIIDFETYILNPLPKSTAGLV